MDQMDTTDVLEYKGSRDRQDHQGIMGIKEAKVCNNNYCLRYEAIF